ncbi:MAG: hemerythrin domain-containing protein [Chromatiaceae bacterium]|nr:hemerythrin domain-containing protein [Chromatiaceae bacterium]
MQRDSSLRSLSSEHHTGLVIARRAADAAYQDEDTRAAAWSNIQEIFRTDLEPHFQREEQGLLSALREAGEVDLVERTLREHRALRAMIAEERVDNLALFAGALKAHIRFEERQLFEAAQRLLGSERLAQMELDESP